jgi:fused signal recognition particle receptor
MAFGFIKKVFSFGQKEAEQRRADDAPLTPVDESVAEPPQPAAAPPLPDFLKRAETPSSASEAEAASFEPLAEIPAAPAPLREEPAPFEPAPEFLRREPEPPVADPQPEAPAQPAPEAEIAAPLRQPSPIEAQPILDEVAPEPEAIPTPVPQPAGRVTVTRQVERKSEPVDVPMAAGRTTWFQRLREGLSRSSKELSGNISGVFTKRKLDEETLQDLEDVLIRADLGLETALRVTDALSASRYGRDVSDAEVRGVMAVEIEKVLAPVALPLELDLSHKPHVILVVGVNGTGKTTTIGKLAAKLTAGGLSVMLAAGDTFRAAAIEQLKIWGERTRSPVVASRIGADAAGLAWDAFEKAKAAGSDVLIIDTAGRLQNKTELMAELEKIVRVLGKHDPDAPHTVLQTVDATTGQNALNQVEIFRNVAGVNGLVMTKLDGTARGGILVAIAAKHKLPVYFIGVGEQIEDLEPFSASDFAKAIAGVG